MKLLWYILIYVGEVPAELQLCRGWKLLLGLCVGLHTGGGVPARLGMAPGAICIRRAGVVVVVPWFGSGAAEEASQSGRWNKENMETSTASAHYLSMNWALCLMQSGSIEIVTRILPTKQTQPRQYNAQQQAEMQLPNQRITLQPRPQS